MSELARLRRLEDRDPPAEIAARAARGAQRRELGRQYGDLFPELRGRAEAERERLVVTADAHGRLRSASTGRRTSLGKLTTATAEWALAERSRRRLVAERLEADDRRATPPPAASPAACPYRGAAFAEELDHLEQTTLAAIAGRPDAREELRGLLAAPVHAAFFGSEDDEDYCEVLVDDRHGLVGAISYPNLVDGLELGKHAHWCYLAAVAEHRRFYAEEYEDRVADPALPVVRRFPPLPELDEDQAVKDERERFQKTLKVSTV